MWEICERRQAFLSPRAGCERKSSSNVLSLWHEQARQSREWFSTPSCWLIDGNRIGDSSGGRCSPCLPSGAAALRLTEMATEQAGLADLLQQGKLAAGEISNFPRGAGSEWSLMYVMLVAFIQTQRAGKLERESSVSVRQGNDCRWYLPSLKTAASSGPYPTLGFA